MEQAVTARQGTADIGGVLGHARNRRLHCGRDSRVKTNHENRDERNHDTKITKTSKPSRIRGASCPS